MYKANIPKRKLFDGTQDVFAASGCEVNIEGNAFLIKLSDFYDNNFEYLEKEINQLDFHKILEQEYFIQKSILSETYSSEENLKVYFLIKDDWIILLSFGEYQLNRYRLFLESVWKKSV